MIRNGKIIGENCDNAIYRSQSVPRGNPAYVMTRTALCDFFECPSKWLRGKEDEGTPATDWGSLLDCMLLDRSNFDKRYAIIPPTYPAGPKHAKVKSGEMKIGDPLPWNANATYCQEWLDVNTQNREVTHTEDVEEVGKAIARLFEDADVDEILCHSQSQVMVTAEWNDPDTGLVIPVKTLVDLVPGDHCEAPEASESLIDLKSSRSANPEKWARDVASYHLHTQGAFYLAVWNSIPGVRQRKYFKHVISENEPPYHLEKSSLTSEFLDIGTSIYTQAFKLYCQCLKTGEWPGYPCRLKVKGWNQCEPTAWMMASQP